VIDGWRRIDRRCRRRAAAADRWWRGRGCSNYGEDRDGTGQRVAGAASLGSRGCAEMVGWLGSRAGSRTRRWLPGGGRRDTDSGEPTARADQQARAGATGGPKGVGSSTCCRGKAGGGGVHREASMADDGSSVLARGRTGRLYSRARGGWGRFSCAPREPSQGMGHGMAGVRREGAAATCGVYAGARLVGRRGYGGTAAHGCEARGAREGGRIGGSTAHGPAGRRLPRRSDPRGWVAVSARDAARRDATSCSAALWLKAIPSALLRIEFSQFFQTELHQGLTTKVAHLTALYKFCKGFRVLDQRF
jgi:hypothetical protein